MNHVNTSLFKAGQTVAVAVSGGKDSVALIHFLRQNAKKLNINVIALNVEHGIRGDNSVRDTEFVKKFCKNFSLPLLTYSVDSLKYAEKHSVSVEQAARKLRYDCFYNAIFNNKCDVVATAHHKKDNFESVLLNLFRGTGLKGLAGINDNYNDKIIRPLLDVSKSEIESYIQNQNLPFVDDETNADTCYTRNALRHLIIPKIEKLFPEAENAVSRFCKIAKTEDTFLDELAKKHVIFDDNVVKLSTNMPDAIFPRAVIIALKSLGLTHDWEKSHVDNVQSLKNLSCGSKISLPNDFIAIKEYDTIVILKKSNEQIYSVPFTLGKQRFAKQTIAVEKVSGTPNLKDGLYGDFNKIPENAVIRTKKDGDVFVKFGGGTKNLGDFLTDKKIPLRLRDNIPVLAVGNEILVVFGIAISNNIKVDETTKNIIKFTSEKQNET